MPFTKSMSKTKNPQALFVVSIAISYRNGYTDIFVSFATK